MTDHTIERCPQAAKIASLEITDKFIMEEIKEIKESQRIMGDKMDKWFVDINNKIDKFIQEAPKKYAPKWVEMTIKWTAWLIVGAVILAVLNNIMK